jgi:heme A synthase
MSRFERCAWTFLAYLLFVILFGAWVRISGSGDGCGNHWPLCGGEVVPVAPGTKKLIEFSHRLTSGLGGIFGFVMMMWARRQAPRVFRASVAAFVFLMLEAFIGAVLVKKELVAGDASSSRAIVVALHLCNTMLLTASAAAMAWWARPSRRAESAPAGSRAILAGIVVLLFATNATGAVTALGDTLFPVKAGLEKSQSAQHFLVRLRVVHPVVAMTSVVLIGAALLWLMKGSPLRLLKSSLHALGGQAALGFLNIALGAPGWMQIAHLLAAQIVWILIFLSVLTLSSRKP